ncbi:hypothetical protein ACFRKB_29015 [Streptomyces scopuliridis]|uniref:hypothetical protein n=1 Tax=Streptomyces scopuliridis TaxID=452529 RepID=UPI003697FAC3
MTYVIAPTCDLRVISGFRELDFWRCDVQHATPVALIPTADDAAAELGAVLIR